MPRLQAQSFCWRKSFKDHQCKELARTWWSNCKIFKLNKPSRNGTASNVDPSFCDLKAFVCYKGWIDYLECFPYILYFCWIVMKEFGGKFWLSVLSTGTVWRAGFPSHCCTKVDLDALNSVCGAPFQTPEGLFYIKTRHLTTSIKSLIPSYVTITGLKSFCGKQKYLPVIEAD